MNIVVEGAACIGSFGFGKDDLFRAFSEPLSADASGGSLVLPKADVSVLSRFLSPRAARQTDHFSRMALVCAYAAVNDAGLAPEDMHDAGVVLATGYGPAAPTFAFLDSIEEYGARMASPLAFSHSVHNIPAATVALKLGAAGPCVTICQLESSVVSGLLAAAVWLKEGRVSRVLFGAVDETTPVLAHATGRLLRKTPREERRRGDLPLGEGSVFFCLSRNTVKSALGRVSDITLRAASRPEEGAALAEELRIKNDDAEMFFSGSLTGLRDKDREASFRRGQGYGNTPAAMAFDMLAALDFVAKSARGKAVCVSLSPAGFFGAATIERGDV